MNQLALFNAPAPAPVVIPSGDADGLRGYQREGVNAWLDHTKTNQGGRIVVFTSGGKTRMGAAIARATKGRVLWLADYGHLLEQARRTLEDLIGEWTTLEKGKLTADASRIVLGSVPTLRGKRLADWAPTAFDLIVYDEMQHSAAAGARRILQHFSSAKRLGLTATDYRLDKKSIDDMGDCVYRRTIEWGIEEAYFAPIVPVVREVRSIDLSKVGIAMGDLKLDDLEKQIVMNAAPIARIAWEESEGGKLPALIFTPGVASAKAVSATFCELAESTWGAGACSAVDGESHEGFRAAVLKSFGGKLRAIANCMIYGEGTDLPAARCVVLARKTKSRGLFEQQAGRGGRLFPGDIGQIAERADRRKAIAASEKPWFKLVDIAGNSGLHTLCSIANVYGGELSELEVKRVQEAIAKPRRKDQMLDEAIAEGKKAAADEQRAAIEAEEGKLAKAAAAAVVATVEKAWDPFKRLGVGEFTADGIEPGWISQAPTPEQRVWLAERRMKGATSRHGKSVSQHTRGTVAKLMAQEKAWRVAGLASFNQRRILASHGLPVELPFGLAQRVITHVIDCKFNARSYGPKVTAMLSEGRIPGEEG